MVSVVIPVRDGARFVGEAVRSALADGVLEVFVVDDGSSDASADVARAAGAHRVIASPARNGASARNVGARAATGELLAFLDADDRFPPGRTAALVAALAACAEADGAFGRQRVFGLGIPLDVPTQAGRTPGTVLIGRRAFLELGGYDESLEIGEAIDFYHRVALAGVRLVEIDDVVLERRRHDANLSARDTDATGSSYLRVARAAILRRRAAEAGD